MTKLARVANSGEVADLRSVLLQKLHQPRCSLVREPEHDVLAYLPLGGVSRDAAENRESRGDRLIDRLQVAVLHVREDLLLRGGEVHQVSLDVAFGTEG